MTNQKMNQQATTTPNVPAARVPIKSIPVNDDIHNCHDGIVVASDHHVGSPHSLHSMSVDSDGDEFSSLEEDDEFVSLVNDIKVILGPTSGLDSDEVDVSTLMKRIEEYKSNSSQWQKYAFFDPAHDYTRNGIDDINHKANLLILVWTPGHGSKVHDHADAHCIVKMLQGTLRETLYEAPKEGLAPQVKRISEYSTDQVSYMSDQIGLHRMHNPGTEVAVSLHLYTPPYASKYGCRVFDDETGESKLVSVSNLYSDQGVKNHHIASSC